MSMSSQGFTFSLHRPKTWTWLDGPGCLPASHPVTAGRDSSTQASGLRYETPGEMVFSHLNVDQQGHRHRCLVYSAHMDKKTIKKVSSQAYPEAAELARGIRGVPCARCIVLLNRLWTVQHTMLHHWQFGQHEAPAAMGSPSCCSFHLS